MSSAIALLVAIALGAALSAAAEAEIPRRPDDCVWTGGDAAAAERFLRQWVRDGGAGTVLKWGIGLNDARGEIEITTESGTYKIALDLGPSCSMPPEARLLEGGGKEGFPTPEQLRALATGFPADRMQRGSERNPSRRTSLDFALVAFAMLGIAALGWRNRRLEIAVQIAATVTLVVIAAWPLLFFPFDTDAPVIRAAATASDVFGDKFHPFLPFALNRPITHWSMEPWALRVVPLAFLCIETVLLLIAARREGGSVAGALAAAWFASEIRDRHGLWDLSDWDFAGTFLLAMLLVLQRERGARFRQALVLAALMTLGMMSSYLMIVPAGVLAGCLAIETIRRRSGVLPALIGAATFIALARVALGVFSAGSSVAAEIGVEDLWAQMYKELPSGRTLAMTVPMALGVAWWARNAGRLPAMFTALCTIAVPVAVYVAHQKSHVAGGYYIGLIVPLLLYAAAVATAGVVQWIAASAARLRGAANRPWVAPVACVALTLVVAVSTIGAGPGEIRPEQNDLGALARLTLAEPLPLYTNRVDLPRLIAFERARAGTALLTVEDAMNGPGDMRPLVSVLSSGACPPIPNPAYYLAYFGPRSEWPGCLEPLVARCRGLGSDGEVQQHGWVIAHCDGTGQ